jgi:hypothetical protein
MPALLNKDGMGGNRDGKESRVRVFPLGLLALFGGGWPAASQAALTCTTAVAVTPSVRWEGQTERVGDIVLSCSGGTPNAPITASFTIFLNTTITSNLLDHNTIPTTEALLLLNEPAPVLQVLGANVFRALKAGGNSITWPGVTFAPDSAGKVTLRFTNIRVNATPLNPLPAPVISVISVSSNSAFPINNPTPILGFVSQGLNFSTSEVTPVSFKLNFQENFPTAFMKKIEVNASGNPISQNVPGNIYNTESGFTTNFSSADATGRADTGTRLVARFKNLPTGTFLLVPISVQSNSSTLSARLLTQVNPDYSGGQPASSGFLPICQNSTFAVYEIDGPALINGAVVAERFTIPVTVLGPSGFGGGVVSGNLGPISAITTMSLEAPEPRFMDTASTAFPMKTCVYLPLTIQ